MPKQLFSFILLLMSSMIGVHANDQLSSVSFPIDPVMNMSHVRCVMQDSSGYVWLGTNTGLFRYDGYGYIKLAGKGIQGEASMSIYKISAWGDRYIWLQTRGNHYACLDKVSQDFIEWSGCGKDGDSYRSFLIQDENHLWLYDSQAGCRHVWKNGNQFVCQDYGKKNKNLLSDQVSFVQVSSDNHVWIGTAEGLNRISNGQSVTMLKGEHFVSSLEVKGIGAFFITVDGKIFCYTKGRVIKVFVPSEPLSGDVKALAYEDGTLIVATKGLTYSYDIRQHRMDVHPVISIKDARIVKDNRHNNVVFDHIGEHIWYITPQKTYYLMDIYGEQLTRQNSGGRFQFIYGKDGVIWISTYGNGLYAYQTQTGEIRHYRYHDGRNAIINSDYLLAIAEGIDGNIFVCQESQGVVMLGSMVSNTFRYYFTDDEDYSHVNNIRLIEHYGSQELLVGNRLNGLRLLNRHLQDIQSIDVINDDVVAMMHDQAGRVWIGTRNQGVLVDKYPVSGLSSGKVSDIVCDAEGRIWVSMFDSGLFLMESNGNGQFSARQVLGLQDNLIHPRLMKVDYRGNIWLCSDNGLYLFNPSELLKNNRAYQEVNVGNDQLKYQEVHCIYEDSQHRIWAGVSGCGLALLDSQGQLKRLFTTADGLSSHFVESVIEDKKGNIWIGTGSGLCRYDTNGNFNVYYLHPHRLGNMYTEGCAVRLDDGRLLFGTLHGMVSFDPDKMTVNKSLFPLAVTDIHVNGESMFYVDGKLYEDLIQGKLTLLYDQNSLIFYFSDFEYLGQNYVKYSYWLEGYDEKWSPFTQLNFATYKNLPSGNYVLHVRACSMNGVWNEHEVNLEVAIRPPFWNTWWAYLIYFLIITVIIYIVLKNISRIQDLRNKVKLENQLTEYKLRFFTNISHEFRTPLTIIKAAMDRMTDQGSIPGHLKQPVSSMRKSVDRMTRLINELLEFRTMQNEKLKLKLEETDVISFLRNISQTFTEAAEKKQITFQFLPFAKTFQMYVDCNYLDKIVYNLLSNAFKYTPSKHSVTFRVRLDETRERPLLIEVEDTGIGMSQEAREQLFTRFQQSTFLRNSIGVGLHMVYELVQIHHGAISYRENPKGGSIFTVELPVDKSVYEESDFMVADSLLLKEENDEEQRSYSSYQEMADEPLNSQKILLVDDDDDLRDYLKNELQRYFVIETAADGQEALEKMAESKPALVISDVKMPVMGGFDLTRKIRQSEDMADIPVILLTAISDEEKMLKGMEIGADDYMEKPFSIKQLLTKSRKLIEQRQKLKIRYAKDVVEKSPTLELIMDNQERKFQERLDAWLDAHLSDPNLPIFVFAKSMGYGRTTFFGKMKKLTGMPPNEYIRKKRMERAAELLRDPALTISEVAYRVGFDDPNYFSRIFKDYYGITASKYRKGVES